MVTVDDGKAGRTGPPFSGKARTWKVADKGEQATNGYIGVLFNGTEDGEATALQAPSKTALASAAPEFVPRAGASEFVPRAAAAAFVPRMGSTTGSATATEFVPGNSSWGWQQANNWPPGRRAGTASASGAWPWSGTSQSQPSQSGNCWFNQDAYSTGSSSPRDSDAGEDFSRLASHEVKPESGVSAPEVVVRTESGTGGDPGYKCTALMSIEAALCCALERSRCAAGGVVTPAFGLGQTLVDRLNAAGMRIYVDETARSML